MLWGLLGALLATATSVGANVGPQALYSRLAGQVLNISGNVFGGGSAAYQVQPYVTAYQNPDTAAEYSLGTFFAYQAVAGKYSYMLYSGGSAAGGCPYQRALSVYINCGPTFNVTSVSEPVICSYQLVIQMPEACGISMAVGNENASASASFVPSPSSAPTLLSMISAIQTFSVSSSASSSASSMATISGLGSWVATATAPGTGTATGSNTPTASVTPTPAQGMRINVNTLYNLTTQTINSMTVVQGGDSSMTTIVAVVVAVNFAVLFAVGIILRQRLYGSAAKADKPLSATAPKMPLPPPPPPPTEPKKVSWGTSVGNSILKAAGKAVSAAAPAAAPAAAQAAPAQAPAAATTQAPKTSIAASTAPSNKPAAS